MLEYDSMIKKLRAEYNSEDAFRNITSDISERVFDTKIFVGSDDLLGYYEPDLIDLLQDKYAKKGHFVKKIPARQRFWIYYYDINGNLLKIEFFSSDNDNADFTVCILKDKENYFYLLYGYDSKNENIELQSFYILSYNNKLLGSVYKCVYDKYLKRYFETVFSLYEYAGHNLTGAYKTDYYREWYYEFKYSENGYMSSYVLKNGRYVYEQNVKTETIYQFEKFGMYHFSPYRYK